MVQNKVKVYQFLISSSISTFVLIGINILLYVFDYFILDNTTSHSLIGLINILLYVFDYFILDNTTSHSLIGLGNSVGISSFGTSFSEFYVFYAFI